MKTPILNYPLELNQDHVDYVSFTHHKYQSNKAGGPLTTAEGPPILLYMPSTTPALSQGMTGVLRSLMGLWVLLRGTLHLVSLMQFTVGMGYQPKLVLMNLVRKPENHLRVFWVTLVLLSSNLVWVS